MSYSKARANLAKLMDTVVDDSEVVIIERRGREPVALVSAAELASLRETDYLLRSPRNAKRLLAAHAAKGRRMTLEDLRREVGLGKKS